VASGAGPGHRTRRASDDEWASGHGPRRRGMTPFSGPAGGVMGWRLAMPRWRSVRRHRAGLPLRPDRPPCDPHAQLSACAPGRGGVNGNNFGCVNRYRREAITRTNEWALLTDQARRALSFAGVRGIGLFRLIHLSE
jgi:hypothetical protein